MTFSDLRGPIISPKISFELQVLYFTIDIHSVVKFKDYMSVFGEELKQKQFLTFNENLKFRVSQRLVVSIREATCKLKLNEEKRITVSANNLSANLLDQSKWVDEALNPILLLPGLQNQNVSRPLLKINEYMLQSLGFVQIFLVD